jgi:hypothetical protein
MARIAAAACRTSKKVIHFWLDRCGAWLMPCERTTQRHNSSSNSIRVP